MPPLQMQEQHQSHVLELVLPYLDTREMHCRASLVSQHISGCMRAHIRQHIAAFLEQYLSCRGWLQDKPKPKGVSTSSSAEHPRFSSVRWLCGCAGAEAMGSAAAAGAVLSAGVSLYSRKDVTRELVQSGAASGLWFVGGGPAVWASAGAECLPAQQCPAFRQASLLSGQC